MKLPHKVWPCGFCITLVTNFTCFLVLIRCRIDILAITTKYLLFCSLQLMIFYMRDMRSSVFGYMRKILEGLQVGSGDIQKRYTLIIAALVKL